MFLKLKSASEGASLLSSDKSSGQLWFSEHQGHLHEKYTTVFNAIHHERH